MRIKMPCPRCRRALSVRQEDLGTTQRCPFCKQEVLLAPPGTRAQSGPPPAPRTAPASAPADEAGPPPADVGARLVEEALRDKKGYIATARKALLPPSASRKGPVAEVPDDSEARRLALEGAGVDICPECGAVDIAGSEKTIGGGGSGRGFGFAVGLAAGGPVGGLLGGLSDAAGGSGGAPVTVIKLQCRKCGHKWTKNAPRAEGPFSHLGRARPRRKRRG